MWQNVLAAVARHALPTLVAVAVTSLLGVLLAVGLADQEQVLRWCGSLSNSLQP